MAAVTGRSPVTPPVTRPSPPVGEPAVRVRRARRGDLPRTARVHQRHLPDGFFARLGARFLTRYHASFAASRRASLLVAEQGHEVVGFLAGTVDNPAHYREVVRRHPVGLLLSALAALARDRELAAEFARTRTARYARALARYLRGRRGQGGVGVADGDDATRIVAVLTHVAVAAEARGTGAGRALVDTFTEVARTGGADEIRLVTATDGVGPRFYRRLGWSSRGRRPAADGTVVEEFVRRL